jgi:hypothetical protein
VKSEDFLTERLLFDELVILLKDVGVGLAKADVDFSELVLPSTEGTVRLCS